MAYNLGTATGRIVIDGSEGKKGFELVGAAADAFYGVVQKKLDSIDQLGTKLIAIGTTGAVGLGTAVKAAATFEAGLSAVKAVSGATTEEMESLRKKALQIGKDTSFSASEAVSAIQELTKAGVSTTDILNGAADATVALAAAGELDLPRAAEIASSAINNFALSGKELPHVADLIAGAANASAIDVGDFGYSLSQAGAVANLTGLKFDDLAVAIAEMGQAGIKGSDAGTSIKTFLTNLIPTTDKQKAMFEELGLQTVKTGADFTQLTKAGLKPASSSMADVTKSLEAYVEKSGGAKKGTVENAKAATQLGIDMGIVGNAFFDAQGKMVPFREIQGTLSNATKDLSKEQKLMALDTLFGSDAIRASAVFANQGAAGFDKMAGAIGKVSAADVAKTRLDNLNGSIEQMKGSLETAQIIIGEVFLPFLRKIVDAATAVINVFNNFPEPLQRTIAIMLGVGTAMSLATGIAIKLAFALGPVLARMLGLMALRQVFSIFTTGFAAMRAGTGVMAALGAMGGRAGVVFTRFARIGSILFAVLSRFPRILGIIRAAGALAFGPWGIALAAVVAGVILAYKHFKPFHDLVDSIAVIIKGVLLNAFHALQDAFDQVVLGFQSGEKSAKGFTGFLQLLGVIANIIVAGIQNLGRAFMEHVVPALQAAGGSLLTTLKEAWESIAATFQAQVVPALRELGAEFQKMLPALKELWVQIQPIVKVLGILVAIIVGSLLVVLFAWAKIMLTYIVPALIQLATIILQDVIGVITFLIQVFIAASAGIITAVTSIVTAVIAFVKAVSTSIGGLVEAVKGFVNVIIGIFTGDWTRAWEGAKQVVSGIKTAITSIMTGLKDVLLGIIKALINGIINFFKNLYDTLVGHSIVPDMVNAIIKWIAQLPGRAAGALADLGSAILGKVRAAMNGMRDGIRDGIDNALDLMRSIPGRLAGALGNTGNILKNAGQWIIQGLIDGIASWVPNLKGYLQNITGWISSWKGPMDVDKKLLTDNGVAIMQSLVNAFKSQVPEVQSFLRGVTNLIGDGITIPDAWSNNKTIDNAIKAGAGNTVTSSPVTSINDAVTNKQTNTDKLRTAVGNAVGTTTVNNNWVIHNPIAEKTSVTTVRNASRRAAIGVLA